MKGKGKSEGERREKRKIVCVVFIALFILSFSPLTFVFVSADQNAFPYCEDEIIGGGLIENEDDNMSVPINHHASVLPESSGGNNASWAYRKTTATPITTCTELQNINDNLAGDYYLANDIDCSDTVNWNKGEGFEPIGPSFGKEFSGTFDGKGYKITNLYINRPETELVGLFGSITSGAKIENVGIEKVSVIGNEYVGGLVGGVDKGATVNNSYSTGDISGNLGGIGGFAGHVENGKLSNCYFKGTVNGEGVVGGFAGYNKGLITNSHSSGSVSGNEKEIGGFVGCNEGSVSNCYSRGSVSGKGEVGGLVGANGEIVDKCYSTGKVTAKKCFGGLVGDNGGKVADSYYDAKTSGCSDTGKGEPKTTAEMKQQKTFDSWDFKTIWAIEEGLSYPYFQWQWYKPFMGVPQVNHN